MESFVGVPPKSSSKEFLQKSPSTVFCPLISSIEIYYKTYSLAIKLELLLSACILLTKQFLYDDFSSLDPTIVVDVVFVVVVVVLPLFQLLSSKAVQGALLRFLI